jgi:hypothetical protein
MGPPANELAEEVLELRIPIPIGGVIIVITENNRRADEARRLTLELDAVGRCICRITYARSCSQNAAW